MGTSISACQKMDSSFSHPLLLWVFYVIKSPSVQSPKARASRPSSECGDPVEWVSPPDSTCEAPLASPQHSCPQVDCFSHTLASSNLPSLSCLRLLEMCYPFSEYPSPLPDWKTLTAFSGSGSNLASAWAPHITTNF